MTTTTSATTGRRRAPSYALLLGSVFGICVVGMTISILVEMQTGYVGRGDQPRSLGEQLAGVVGFGCGAFVVALLGGRLLATSPKRARTGAIAYGVLSVLTLPFFWCGMPGMLGATAAHLSGLTADGIRPSGNVRALGIVGLVLAVVNALMTFLGVGISWAMELL